MLHTFSNTLYIFLSPDKRELIDNKQEHTERNLYYNHADIFVDLPQR